MIISYRNSLLRSRKNIGFELTNEFYSFSGVDNNLDNWLTPRPRWNPKIYYQDGRTYIALNLTKQSPHLKKPFILQYYNGVVNTNIINDSPGADYHNNSTIMCDSEGYVFFTSYNHVQKNQSGGYVKIFKSNQPHDISNFTLFQEFTGVVGYPNLFRIENTMALIFRHGGDGTGSGIAVRRSIDGGQFGDMQQITYLTEESSSFPWLNQRHYYTTGTDCVINGKFNMQIAKRWAKDGSVYQFTKHWHLKTSDFITWENVDGSFSKNTTLSESELNENYLYHDLPYEAYQNESGVLAIDLDGNPNYLNTNRQNSNELWIRYNGGWSINVIDEPFQLNWVRNSKINTKTLVFHTTGAYIFLHEMDDGIYKVKAYHTPDYGISFKNTITINKEVEQSSYCMLPINMRDIPKNQRFAIISQSFIDQLIGIASTTPVNDLYIKIAIKK